MAARTPTYPAGRHCPVWLVMRPVSCPRHIAPDSENTNDVLREDAKSVCQILVKQTQPPINTTNKTAGTKYGRSREKCLQNKSQRVAKWENVKRGEGHGRKDAPRAGREEERTTQVAGRGGTGRAAQRQPR
ncbi:hypothetical protein Bbelb_294510 [Branchiostoma belcheri]|nr:hypothetical protein Bbelb_294510 [Branchiostoma belcheri]